MEKLLNICEEMETELGIADYDTFLAIRDKIKTILTKITKKNSKYYHREYRKKHIEEVRFNASKYYNKVKNTPDYNKRKKINAKKFRDKAKELKNG